MQKMHLQTPFGELIALPRPLSGFGGPFCGWDGKVREGKGKGRRQKRRKRKGRGGKGKGREEREMEARDRGEEPLRLRIPGNFFYPSPPLSTSYSNSGWLSVVRTCVLC